MGSCGLLPLDVIEGRAETELTALSGLVLCGDMASVLRLPVLLDHHVGTGGSQGWRDRDHVLALVLLNLAGGDCVDDIEVLESDGGARRVFEALRACGLSRRERKEDAVRFRKGRQRSFPSATRIHEYLESYHDESDESRRCAGHAHIPTRPPLLSGLMQVNTELVAEIMARRPEREVTLDVDATLVETTKREAQYCYQGCRAYQPLTAYWHETGLVVHSEFRDGNVPAGYDMLRFVREAVQALPDGVKKVRVRMDSAGYQHDVLSYMASGDNGRRAPVEFTVSCDVTQAFRDAAQAIPEAEWHDLPSRRGEPVRQWSSIVFVPMAVALAKHEPHRYIAIREVLRQPPLPGLEDAGGGLPFRPVAMVGTAYRVRGIVTNMDLDGASIVRFHYGRCGKGEEIHSVLKSDFAGGVLPSKRFGANAAWWAIVVLAHNLMTAMRRLAFPKSLRNKRMKAIRFLAVAIPAFIARHARRVAFHIAQARSSVTKFAPTRARIAACCHAPP